MNGNTPYGGRPGVVEAGHRSSTDAPTLTRQQRKHLRDSATAIAARTRSYLTDGFAVGSEVSAGVGGPRVTVAVRPPVGNPVSAGFEASFDGEDAALVEEADREEVARGLAASAALQVKHVLDDEDVVPAAQ
ncbi:MAG: DUF5811 family protein [Halobacteriaceae archaeon]